MTKEERGYNYPLFCYIRRRLNERKKNSNEYRDKKGEEKNNKKYEQI